MLTAEEQAFVAYWAVQRDRRRTVASRISSGLPLGVGIVLVLFLSIATGWYQRATMVMRTHSSVILVIVLAAVGIVLFMSYFSAQHEWDQNEERYQVLLQKQKRADAANEL
ncbi:MAG: hypothetical protein EOO11_01285 [Chitinophagaceae bacterium]|nr:MAG: hypothetical protein EOO11_01285 [Chitinophagaceae bacterium]